MTLHHQYTCMYMYIIYMYMYVCTYIHISYCSLDTGPVVIETMWANYPLTSPSIQYMYIAVQLDMYT